jgi:hypothetical protein
MSLTTTAQIDRGRTALPGRNPELEICFYGKNIAQYEVTTSNSIAITNIKKTENPNFICYHQHCKDVAVAETISFQKQ